jgi:hypothetical protein
MSPQACQALATTAAPSRMGLTEVLSVEELAMRLLLMLMLMLMLMDAVAAELSEHLRLEPASKCTCRFLCRTRRRASVELLLCGVHWCGQRNGWLSS